jgi:hypothetical protein
MDGIPSGLDLIGGIAALAGLAVVVILLFQELFGDGGGKPK